MSPRFSSATGETASCDPEKIDKLEQLRVLSAGFPIAVRLVDQPTSEIDTPDVHKVFAQHKVTRQKDASTVASRLKDIRCVTKQPATSAN